MIGAAHLCGPEGRRGDLQNMALTVFAEQLQEEHTEIEDIRPE